jgi:hypothetical protein
VFQYRLALALGMTRQELLARMTSAELSEWQALYQLEPFGDLRADLRAGIVAATVANVNRAKGTSPAKPSQFMPLLRNQKPQPMDAAGFKAAFGRIAKAYERS